MITTIRFRGLMEPFHCRHLKSALRHLQAICHQYDSAVAAEQTRVTIQDKGDPYLGERLSVRGRAVEEVQEAVVAEGGEAKASDHAGHSEQVIADAEG